MLTDFFSVGSSVVAQVTIINYDIGMSMSFDPIFQWLTSCCPAKTVEVTYHPPLCTGYSNFLSFTVF